MTSDTVDWNAQRDLRELDRCRVPHDCWPFTFEKAERRGYWVVKGPVPLEVARVIYADPASDVIRVAGHCAAPPPDDWATWRMPDGTQLASEREGEQMRAMSERHGWGDKYLKEYTFSDDPDVHGQADGYVETYHIDTEVGLRVFVDHLRWNGVLR